MIESKSIIPLTEIAYLKRNANTVPDKPWYFIGATHNRNRYSIEKTAIENTSNHLN